LITLAGNNSRILGGLPHSEIHGSKLILSSPWLIAEYHVFHRLLLPRHSPNALFALDLIQKKKDLIIVLPPGGLLEDDCSSRCNTLTPERSHRSRTTEAGKKLSSIIPVQKYTFSRLVLGTRLSSNDQFPPSVREVGTVALVQILANLNRVSVLDLDNSACFSRQTHSRSRKQSSIRSLWTIILL
jgi:hypothetical protein